MFTIWCGGEGKEEFQGRENIFKGVESRSFWKLRWETGNNGKK